MKAGPRIDYKTLRKVNPETARLAVLECLKTNGGNVSDAARVFGINQPVVYDILKKQREGDRRDRSKVSKHQPSKTAPHIEDQVIEAKNKTRMGHKRLSIYLEKYEELSVPAGTIRHILRRNREHLVHLPPSGHSKRRKREFIDWYQAKVFEVVQIDVKHIRDQKALTREQILHLHRVALSLTTNGARWTSTLASSSSPTLVSAPGPMASASICG